MDFASYKLKNNICKVSIMGFLSEVVLGDLYLPLSNSFALHFATVKECLIFHNTSQELLEDYYV